MKKRTIYILLIILVGFNFTTACNNEKDFYDYNPTPDEKPTPDEPAAEQRPYTLNIAIKMSTEDLARLARIDGKLNGIVPYTPSATRADEDKNTIRFEFTKTANGISASFQVLEVNKNSRQVLVMTMTQTNGNVISTAADMTESLSTMAYESAEIPVNIEVPEIILPDKAEDAIGGGSLSDWNDPTNVSGEAGSKINDTNE